MNSKNMKRILKTYFLALLAVPVLAGPSFAVDLVAIQGTWLPPGGTVGVDEITMWGFAADTGQACDSLPVWDVGPVLTNADLAGGNLTINLRNCLTEPVSVFIPGQIKSTSPVPLPSDTNRVRSFDAEVAAGTSGLYTWTDIKPGTYMYQSGTFIAKQVPMGLYGALVVDYGPNCAYDNGTGPCDVPFAQDEVLIYSEIDPDLNNGVYGNVGARVNNYQPRYFLINGETYPNTGNITAVAGQDVLLRFINAGLQTYVPTLQGLYMNVSAEDGNQLPYALDLYQIELTPAKTMDATINLSAGSRHALYDRSLHLAVESANGGMLTFIQASDVVLPVAAPDSYTIAEGNTLTVAAPGVLDNDTGTGLTAYQTGTAPPGALTLNTDGSFMYTPAGAGGSIETFQYYASDGTNNSAPATVTITVGFRPIANNDLITIPRNSGPIDINVIANDIDTDGTINPDSIVLRSATSTRGVALVVNNDGTGTVTYTPDGGGGADFFWYTVMDDSGATSNEATVRINRVAASPAPAAAPNAINGRGRSKSR